MPYFEDPEDDLRRLLAIRRPEAGVPPEDENAPVPIQPPEAPQTMQGEQKAEVSSYPPIAPPAPAPAPAQASSQAYPPVRPAQERYQALLAQGEPQLHGFKKFLNVVGSVFAPGAVAAIRGTPLNYRDRLRGAEHAATEESTLAERAAQTEEAQARTESLRRPPEKAAEWEIQDGVDGQGNPVKVRVNKLTGDVQPLKGIAPKSAALKEGETPLGANVSNLNQALTDRFQVLNPGQKLPPQYTLSPNATQNDYARVDRALEQVERARGTAAQQAATRAIQQQTFAMAQQKKSDQQERVETVARGLTRPGSLTSIKLVASMRGDERGMIYAEAMKLDPNFDPGLIEQRIKFLQQYENPTGRAAMNRQAINNIMQHAGDLIDVNKAYGRADARFLNAPTNTIARQFGNTAYVNYSTTLGVLKDELGLYFAGGYAPQGEQLAMWNKILDESATPKQVETFAKEVTHLALRRATTFNSQFKTNMGIDDPNMVIPEAKRAAVKLGLEKEVEKFGSGGQLTGAGQPIGEETSDMVTVQIPGHTPGQIPRSALEQFKKDNPKATVKK
jgi:hypothetical protein